MVTLGLVGTEDGYMVKIVPPQTNDGDIPVGKGAYCFVIDVSGRCARHPRPGARMQGASPRCGRSVGRGHKWPLARGATLPLLRPYACARALSLMMRSPLPSPFFAPAA